MQTFSGEAVEAMCRAIEQAGGAEVFFVGRPAGEAAVGEVEVAARGHDSAVPALLSRAHAGEVLIHNHPSGRLQPSDADLAIASRAGELGLGFIIIDNHARQHYTVVEPFQPRQQVPVDAVQVRRLLGQGGLLERALADYEPRPQQLEMSLRVADSFNRRRQLMVEAGTGTGKSLAYLVPALLHAVGNRERVVVSTNTINLQEQLIRKDLPLIADKLGLEFKSCLLKGRSNYLCRRKAEYARSEAAQLFEDEQRASLDAVLAWAQRTGEGTRADLPFVPPAEVWEAVAADADDCLRVRSPWFNECFYFDSRREAASADLIVVNHHLLLADVALRLATGDWEGTAVLPPYRHLIIDEAHNLEDVASDYLASSVTGAGLKRGLGRLRSSRQPQRGLLPTLERALAQCSLAPRDVDKLADLLGGELDPGQSKLVAQVDAAFQRAAHGIAGYLGLSGEPPDDLKLRLKPRVLMHPAFGDEVLPPLGELSQALGGYVVGLGRFLALADEAGGLEDRLLQSGLSRLAALRSRFAAASQLLARLGEPAPDLCRWIETRRRGGQLGVRVMEAPLEIGQALAEGLWSQASTAVLTSATLSVGDSFDYFAGRLGCQAESGRLDFARYSSPFDYARQALLAVPSDMPEPQDVRYGDALGELLERALKASRGRAFVLFTSYSLLRRMHARLSSTLAAAGLELLRQGDAPRELLLSRFRGLPAPVLFATQSFWEGVDVPGETLSLVVLTRLPFRVPSEPLQEARVEAIAQRGADPFSEYSLPQAVIRFRQGFGRLIRRRSDSGVVLVADSRVVGRRYGRLFLDSLPDARQLIGPRSRVYAELERLYAEPAAAGPGQGSQGSDMSSGGSASKRSRRPSRG